MNCKKAFQSFWMPLYRPISQAEMDLIRGLFPELALKFDDAHLYRFDVLHAFTIQPAGKTTKDGSWSEASTIPDIDGAPLLPQVFFDTDMTFLEFNLLRLDTEPLQMQIG